MALHSCAPQPVLMNLEEVVHQAIELPLAVDFGSSA